MLLPMWSALEVTLSYDWTTAVWWTPHIHFGTPKGIRVPGLSKVLFLNLNKLHIKRQLNQSFWMCAGKLWFITHSRFKPGACWLRCRLTKGSTDAQVLYNKFSTNSVWHLLNKATMWMQHRVTKNIFKDNDIMQQVCKGKHQDKRQY